MDNVAIIKYISIAFSRVEKKARFTILIIIKVLLYINPEFFIAHLFEHWARSRIDALNGL